MPTNTEWVFNRNYHDHDQVAQFWPAYKAVYDELVADGQYPYNDSFKGRIPGIEGACEDTAIYLLQGTRHLNDLQVKIDAAVAEGCQPLDPDFTGPEKFRRVINYGWSTGGTGWTEWPDARISRCNNGRPTDTDPFGSGPAQYRVLPKGARTRGYTIYGSILVQP